MRGSAVMHKARGEIFRSKEHRVIYAKKNRHSEYCYVL